MSNKAAPQSPTQQAGGNPPSGDDAQCVLSDTSTLAESKKASSSPKGQGSSSTSTSDSQLDSATGFANEAAKKGWAAPTATRPTFG
ncbi:hypothetical protein OH77DRAFT_1428015 [Trametes cingulata]|nr:hypothetical protein OH77DRAFT_1428015 [Trametes cingulata]